MFISYAYNKFPEDYIPTIFDGYSATIKVGRKRISLGLWDTAGQSGKDATKMMHDTYIYILPVLLCTKCYMLYVK